MCPRGGLPTGRFSFQRKLFSLAFVRRVHEAKDESPAVMPRRHQTRTRLPNLCIGLGVMLLALSTALSGIVAGIFLPDNLVIGRVAPVNEIMVFMPRALNNESEALVYATGVGFGVITNRGAVRALLIVDSALFDSHLQKRVNVSRFSTGRWENYSQPERLIIQDPGPTKRQNLTMTEYRDVYR